MAYRQIEIDFEGMTFYEVEAQLTVRDGELVKVQIESARKILEEDERLEPSGQTAAADPNEVDLSEPTVRALLIAEVERWADDPDTRRELENEDIDAARDDADQAKIDQWKEERRR